MVYINLSRRSNLVWSFQTHAPPSLNIPSPTHHHRPARWPNDSEALQALCTHSNLPCLPFPWFPHLAFNGPSVPLRSVAVTLKHQRIIASDINPLPSPQPLSCSTINTAFMDSLHHSHEYIYASTPLSPSFFFLMLDLSGFPFPKASLPVFANGCSQLCSQQGGVIMPPDISPLSPKQASSP